MSYRYGPHLEVIQSFSANAPAADARKRKALSGRDRVYSKTSEDVLGCHCLVIK
jgi:hypothetical protein